MARVRVDDRSWEPATTPRVARRIRGPQPGIRVFQQTTPKKEEMGVAYLVSISNNIRDLGLGVDLVR